MGLIPRFRKKNPKCAFCFIFEGMKKLTFILFLLSVYAFAQKTDSTKKQIGLVVKGDILLPIINLIGNIQTERNGNYNYVYYCPFTVEKLLKKRHSIQLSFFKNWTQNLYYAEWNYNQWALIPEYKYFISKKKSYTGYYIGSFGEFFSEKVLQSDDALSRGFKTISIGGGISNGVQFYVFKKITIDILLGVGILKPISNQVLYGSYGPSPFDKTFYQSYFTYRAAINIGYKF